jgi:glycosyltransferase involved in cell wall biosynthesis
MSEYSKPKKTVFYISRFYIQGDKDGGSVYILDLLKYLKKSGFEIIYILLPQVRFNRYPVYKIPPQVSELMTVEAERCYRMGNFLVGKFTIFEWLLILIWMAYMQTPIYIKRKYRTIKKSIINWWSKRRKPLYFQENFRKRFDLSPSEIDFIQKMINIYSPMAMIANFASLAGVFDAIPKSSQILKIIQNQDALHQRTGAFTTSGVYLGDLELGWTYDLESEALRKADVVVSIQKEEAVLFKEMSPKSTVICIPKAASIRSVTGVQIPGRCLFVGSWVDQNVVGINWFLKEVWADVLYYNPQANLHICGSVCESISKKTPNVTLLGRVKDLSGEYVAAEVCLVPLLAGSGLKIKLIEALSYGRVVVSTSVGVQGVSNLDGKCVIVEDNPREFAKAIVKLFQDPDTRRQMEKRALATALDKFSAEACYQPLVDILETHLLSWLSNES